MAASVHLVAKTQRDAGFRADIGGNFPLDENVIAGQRFDHSSFSHLTSRMTALPKGTSVISADSFGSSAWTVTARVNVVSPDGAPKSYFLKVCNRKH